MAPEKTNLKKIKKMYFNKPLNMSMPKAKFDEVMELLNKEDDSEEYFKPRCSVPIHNITSTNRNSFKSPLHKLLEEAQLCIMQRDWKNLAKILIIAKPNRWEHHLFFQVLVRYAVLHLAHNGDENQMEMFMSSVAGCRNEADRKLFLKSFVDDC